uniref:Cyclin C-terminal domain-containing protein n=1 Tax=Oryza nivara TaxID=4536 RepID=A0A0E0IKZ5_ORYNI
MAALTSYEMAASILLCAEDSSSVLGFGGEEEEEEEDVVAGKRARCAGPPPPPCVDVAGVDFAVPSEECVARLVETEADHMPREDYAERLRAGGGDGDLDLRVRMDAIDWIWKDGKDWMTQLLAVACLSLAAKMEETDVPQSLDLQVGEERYVFEAKTIQRMELLVLSTLKWRMQAVTPFSYVDYFLRELNGGDPPSGRSALLSSELILCIARGTECLGFRPSEIAAAVVAAVVGEEHAAFSHVNKERMSHCQEVIQAMELIHPKPASPSRVFVSSSIPRSPTGVLDAAGCLSYRSDDSAVASHYAASSWGYEHDSSPVSSKRRKISR